MCSLVLPSFVPFCPDLSLPEVESLVEPKTEPTWAQVGLIFGPKSASGGLLGAPWGLLGALGRSWAAPGPSKDHAWAPLGLLLGTWDQHGAKMGPTLAQHGLKIEVRGLSKALLDRSLRRGRFGDRFRPSFRLENRAEMHGKKCALHALSASVFAPLTGAKKRSCRRGVCFFARFLASSLRGFVRLVTHFSGCFVELCRVVRKSSQLGPKLGPTSAQVGPQISPSWA